MDAMTQLNYWRKGLFLAFSALILAVGSGCGARVRHHKPSDTLPSEGLGMKKPARAQAGFSNREIPEVYAADTQPMPEPRALDLQAIQQAQQMGPDDTVPFFQKPANLLGHVYFEFDKSDISEAFRSELRELASSLQANQSLLLVGYSDWYGTEEYNMALGERRAQAVLNYLEQLGVQAQMETLSRGRIDAVHGGPKEACFRDRRTDVVRIPELSVAVPAESFMDGADQSLLPEEVIQPKDESS